MYKHLSPSFAAVAALALLSACNNNAPAENVVDTNTAAAEPAAPLPMIVKTTAYRCKDGTTFSADFFNDQKTVNVRVNGAALGKQLVTETPGADATYVSADGYELTTTGENAELTTPEAPKQLCKS